MITKTQWKKFLTDIDRIKRRNYTVSINGIVIDKIDMKTFTASSSKHRNAVDFSIIECEVFKHPDSLDEYTNVDKLYKSVKITKAYMCQDEIVELGKFLNRS